MRVLNISSCDYSNYSHSIAKSLRSVGVDCVDICTKQHRFNYSQHSTTVNIAELIKNIKSADVIQIMHSDEYLFNLTKKTNTNAEILIYHTGSGYRKNYAEMNKIFSGHTTVTDQTELMKLGNHHYVVSAVDIAAKPAFVKNNRFNIGHYPSNTEVKGTDQIVLMLSKFKGRFNFRFSPEQIPHYNQMDRINRCDVYVELFKPELNGREYGCFGVTALEAAGLGKLVITQDLNSHIYAEYYGENPFILANSETKFNQAIKNILNMDASGLRDMQKISHRITRQNHSYESTGKKVLSILKSL